MKNKEENFHFETTDMALAATISYFGSKVESIDKTDFSRAKFVFPRTKELDSLVQKFWSDSLAVSPSKYFSCLKNIKPRLYQTD